MLVLSEADVPRLLDLEELPAAGHVVEGAAAAGLVYRRALEVGAGVAVTI